MNTPYKKQIAQIYTSCFVQNIEILTKTLTLTLHEGLYYRHQIFRSQKGGI